MAMEKTPTAHLEIDLAHLEIDLDPGSTPISGVIRVHQRDHRFHGWLELSAAIECAHRAADSNTPTSERQHAADTQQS